MHTPIVKYDFGDSFSSAMVKGKQEEWRKSEAIRKEAAALDTYKEKLKAQNELATDLETKNINKQNNFMEHWYSQLSTIGPYGGLENGVFKPNYDLNQGTLSAPEMWKNIVSHARETGVPIKPGDFKFFLEEYSGNEQLRDEHMIGTLNIAINKLNKQFEGMPDGDKRQAVMDGLNEMGLTPYFNKYQGMFSTEDFIETFASLPPETLGDEDDGSWANSESTLGWMGEKIGYDIPTSGNDYFDAAVILASRAGYKRLKGFMGDKYRNVKAKYGWGQNVKSKTQIAAEEVSNKVNATVKAKGDTKSVVKKSEEIVNKTLNLKRSDLPKGTKKTTIDNLVNKLNSDKINLTKGENNVLKHLLQTNKSPSFVKNIANKIQPNPVNPISFKMNYRRNMDVFDNHIKFLDKTAKGLDKRTISYKNMIRELDEVRSMKYSYKQLENIMWRDRIKQGFNQMNFLKDSRFGKWLNRGGGPGLHMLVAPGVVHKVYQDSFKESGGNEFKANWDASLSMMMFDIPLAFQSKGLITNLMNYGGPKLASRLGISTALASSDATLPIGDAAAVGLNAYWIAKDTNAAVQSNRIHNYYKKNGVPPEDVLDDIVDDMYTNVAMESLKADYNPLMWQNDISIKTLKDLLDKGYERKILTDENGNTKSYGLWSDKQNLAGRPAPSPGEQIELTKKTKLTGRNPEFNLNTGFYSTAIESSAQNLGEFDNAMPVTNQLAEMTMENPPPEDIKELLVDKYGDDWARVWQSNVGYVTNPYADAGVSNYDGKDNERALELFMNKKWNGDLFKKMLKASLLESFYNQSDFKEKYPKQWENKASDAYNRKLSIIKQLENISGEDIPDAYEERIGS